jgi:scyllo-inositol 2-dehydrogenase (NADP+)
MNQPLRVGLIGFGASARTFHLPFFLDQPDRFTVTVVLERKAEEAPRLVPGASVHRDLDAFLADRNWDLAVVTLPNDLHAATAIRVLESGRAVVVEKPLATTTADAQALVDASARTGQPAFAFQSRRLDGDFQLVRRLVGEGTLGRLVRLECRYDRWSNALRKKAWKEQGTGGNTLLEDLGSHLLDQMLTLFGPPAALTCRLGIQRDGSTTVDAFRISLDYPGLWVDLEAGMVTRAPTFHWALHGTGGSFVKGGMDPQEAQLQKGLRPSDPAFGFEDPAQAGVLTPAQGEPVRLETPAGRYAAFYDDVLAVLTEGRKPAFPATDGLAVVKLLDLCRKSASEGRTLTVPVE